LPLNLVKIIKLINKNKKDSKFLNQIIRLFNNIIPNNNLIKWELTNLVI